MQNSIKYWFLIAATIIIGWGVNLVWYKPFSIELFYERMFLQMCLHNPEAYSLNGNPYQLFLGHLGSELNKFSEEHYISEMEVVTKNFEMLRSYKKTAQEENQLITTQVLDHYLEKQIFAQQFLGQRPTINHLQSPHITVIPFMLGVHQIESLHAAEQYLARISQIAIRNKAVTEVLTVKEINENLPSERYMQYMVDQIECFLSASLDSNILYKDFKEKVVHCPNLTEEAKKELLFEARIEIGDNLYPSYLKLEETILSLKKSSPKTFSNIYQKQDGESYWYFIHDVALTTEINRQTLEVTTNKWVSWVKAELEMRLGRTSGGKPKKITNILRDNQLQPKQSLQDKIIVSLKGTDYQELNNLVLLDMPSTHTPFLGMSQYMPGDLQNARSARLFLNNDSSHFFHDYLIPAFVASQIFPGVHARSINLKHKKGVADIHRMLDFDYLRLGWGNYVLVDHLKRGLFSDSTYQVGALQILLADLTAQQIAFNVHFDGQDYQAAKLFFIQETGFSEGLANAYIDQAMTHPEKLAAKIIGLDRFDKLSKEALRLGANHAEINDWFIESVPMPWKMFEEKFNNHFNNRD